MIYLNTTFVGISDIVSPFFFLDILLSLNYRFFYFCGGISLFGVNDNSPFKFNTFITSTIKNRWATSI